MVGMKARAFQSIALVVISVIGLLNVARAEIPLMRDGVPSLAPVIEVVKRSVVNISTTGEVAVQANPLFNDPFFRRFFEGIPEGQGPSQQMRKTQSLGSGVIIDSKNGYVVTNHHVVENATEIVVGIEDGREIKAKMIGSDPSSDVAVIQIEADDIQAISRGDSDGLRVGDYVMAIGSPFGLKQTVTTGIVSALGRSGLNIEELEDFIQTDASINPGNSGGALINLHGELVGINTAILSRSGGNVGIGFAIPVNMVNSIVDQIVHHGEVRRGLLGVNIQDINDEIKETFGISVSSGALVSGINEGSAAEKAGIELGDVITRVEDKKISNSRELVKEISFRTAGETVEIEVYRGKKVLRLKATLDNRNAKRTVATPVKSGDLGEYSELLAGIVVGQDADMLVISSVEQGSIAAQSGLEEGDYLLTVNRVRVRRAGDIKKALKNGADNRVILTIVRDGRRFFAVLEK